MSQACLCKAEPEFSDHGSEPCAHDKDKCDSECLEGFKQNLQGESNTKGVKVHGFTVRENKEGT